MPLSRAPGPEPRPKRPPEDPSILRTFEPGLSSYRPLLFFALPLSLFPLSRFSGLRLAESRRHGAHQQATLERLDQERDGIEGVRRPAGLDGVVGGDEDDGMGVARFDELSLEVDSGDARQADVGDETAQVGYRVRAQK